MQVKDHTHDLKRSWTGLHLHPKMNICSGFWHQLPYLFTLYKHEKQKDPSAVKLSKTHIKVDRFEWLKDHLSLFLCVKINCLLR